jgi:membrane-associated phospholipid phosphatase
MAVLAAWYAWNIRALRGPLLALNILVLAATPIEGGHHLVDVFAGLALAAAAIVLAARATKLPAPFVAAPSAIPDAVHA